MSLQTYMVWMALVCSAAISFAQPKLTREEKVRQDRKKVEAEGFWIYNDLPRAFAEAKKSGKPMLVVLRCIPCEECVKLDDDLVNQDPVIRPLLDKFVCVRVVSTNGLDLKQFQYDMDQSFAVFLLNPDGTVYGRFGTRSHRTNWITDVSLPGMAKAMQGALELHAAYPANKESLAGKRGEFLEYPTPEKFPALAGKYGPKLAETGEIVRSCIHCHQIGDARLDLHRSRKKPIPDDVLFPYPHPRTVGLVLDPKEAAAVEKVLPGSAAEKAGFQAGDAIRTLAGQPMLSMADVQWVLHSVSSEGGKATARVVRGSKTLELTLTLASGWKRAGDLSWRSTSWGLRRMATGGMLLEELLPEERNQLNIPAGSMALRAKHVGEYGAHAAAKNAGFQKGDILIEWDGRKDLLTETEILVHGVTRRQSGERVPVSLLRNGKSMTLTVPMQP